MLHETLTLAFDDQPTDHSGDPVTPLTSAGTPYRYALVGYAGRPETTYASTAEALLSVIIPDYEPLDLDDDNTADDVHRDRYIAQATLRTQYAYGVAFDNAAQALINDQVSEAELKWLQRSLDYDPPLTMQELSEWTAQVPMILLAAYYRRENLAAPAGNIIWLDGYTPELLLEGLAKTGAIQLREHILNHRLTSETGLRLGDPSAVEFLSALRDQLDMTAANLDLPEAEDHHRESLEVLTRRLRDWTELPSYDLRGRLRDRLDQVLDEDDYTPATAKELSKAVDRILKATTPHPTSGNTDGGDSRGGGDGR